GQPAHQIGKGLRGMLATRRIVASQTEFDAAIFFSLDLLPVAWTLPRRCLIVCDFHDYLPRRVGRIKLWLLGARVKLFISVSDFTSRQLVPHQRDRSCTLYRPGPQPQSERPESLSHSRTVGILGRLDRDKNIECVIEALQGVPELDLIIRGASFESNESYVQELNGLINTLLDGRARILEAGSPDTIYDGLLAVIVARPTEPLGRTILEASSFGIPCVVPHTGGPPELVTHEVDGLIYTANSSESLAKELKRLLSRDFAQALGREARVAAQGRMSPTEYANSYIKLVTSGAVL
ncbi:MAG: glycosyltransferase family 4 protein, partial [Alphaproteobacteria bacterium]|nr:glycosyltransferase family 4 protein [Alphaproteobacteria bacterium]